MTSTTEQQPSRPDMDSFFGTLRTELAMVPELQIGLKLTREDPDFAAATYLGYVGLINHVAKLSEDDRAIIRQAKEWMEEGHEEDQEGEEEKSRNYGTASRVTADELLAELDGQVEVIGELTAASASVTSEDSQSAMRVLAERMKGGHALKKAGGQPSDKDEASKKVIWGHTMMKHPNAHTLVHFMVAHYMERYVAVGLLGRGSKLAADKDFLINALVDVLVLDHLTTNRFAPMYNVWRRPKDKAGLEWITDDRLKSYEQQGIAKTLP